MKLYNPKEKIDFFYVQQKWIRFMGMWPSDQPLKIKFIPDILVSSLEWIYRRFVFLILLHCSILFAVSAVIDIRTGTFAEVAYSLSQTVIFSFVTFASMYFHMRLDTYYRITNFINNNFKYRSASG